MAIRRAGRAFWERLSHEIEGDADASLFSRGRYATDASMYQCFPAGVVAPKSAGDIAIVLEMAREEGLSVIARGGGTSTAGQALGEGVIIDFSKYLSRIVEIDADNHEMYGRAGLHARGDQRCARRARSCLSHRHRLGAPSHHRRHAWQQFERHTRPSPWLDARQRRLGGSPSRRRPARALQRRFGGGRARKPRLGATGFSISCNSASCTKRPLQRSGLCVRPERQSRKATISERCWRSSADQNIGAPSGGLRGNPRHRDEDRAQACPRGPRTGRSAFAVSPILARRSVLFPKSWCSTRAPSSSSIVPCSNS